MSTCRIVFGSSSHIRAWENKQTDVVSSVVAIIIYSLLACAHAGPTKNWVFFAYPWTGKQANGCCFLCCIYKFFVGLCTCMQTL